ncbi:MAG: carbohydrate kinase family protein [Emergencia sp.]
MEKEQYIVGIGAANIDIMGRSRRQLVQEDSNPGKISVSVGGATHNACENAARLGAPVTFITTTGDDYFGQMIRSACDRCGIDTSHFVTFPGQTSSTYMSVHNRNGEMDIAVSDMTILQNLTPDHLAGEDRLLRNASAIVFDTGLPQVIIDCILKEYGSVTPVFADSVSTTYAEKLIDNLQGIYTLKPNLLEAEILSGIHIQTFDDLEKAASVLVSKGAQRVFISLGRHGVYYADAQGVRRYRCCHPMDQIANATGAGDSFLGALLYSHIRGLSLEDTLRTAMTVSMLTIQSDATINPLMSESFMKKNLSLAEENREADTASLRF